MVLLASEPEKAANCLWERERESADLLGCVRVVILIVGAQWHGHSCLISQPAGQTDHRHGYNPPITVALRLLTRFPFSIPLPLTFPSVSLLFRSLSFPVWNRQLHRHTAACCLMHMHQKKKTGKRGPRLSQSQTTWRPVTGLPTKSTHCTVGLGGRWRWRGRGGSAAHKRTTDITMREQGLALRSIHRVWRCLPLTNTGSYRWSWIWLFRSTCNLRI